MKKTRIPPCATILLPHSLKLFFFIGNFLNFVFTPNAELTGRFSVIAGELSLGVAEVLQVERLVPKARSAKEPNGRPGTGQLGIPVAQSAAGTKSSLAGNPMRTCQKETLKAEG